MMSDLLSCTVPRLKYLFQPWNGCKSLGTSICITALSSHFSSKKEKRNLFMLFERKRACLSYERMCNIPEVQFSKLLIMFCSSVVRLIITVSLRRDPGNSRSSGDEEINNLQEYLHIIPRLLQKLQIYCSEFF